MIFATHLVSQKQRRRMISACLNVSVDETKKNVNMGLKTKEITEADRKVFVGTYARTPIVLSYGKGCKLYDVEGKEYLDMTSGITVNVLGHGDPDWIKAVEKQANTLTHVSNIFHTIPRVELAKCLVESFFTDCVFFTNSGTKANEAAVEFARKFLRFTHPNAENPPLEFIAFSNCFHRRTMGALSLTSKEHYRLPFEPLVPGVNFLSIRGCTTNQLICSRRIAGVVVEPIQGEGGIYSATK